MVILRDTDTVKISGNMVIIPEIEYEELLIVKQNDEYRKKIRKFHARSKRGEGSY